MSLHKRAKNAATIRVTYPDGCQRSWRTRRDAPIATSVIAFAKWLHLTADEIYEDATTPGRCAARQEPPHEQ